MPDLLRKNCLTDPKSATPSGAERGRTVVPALELPATWQAAPVALAMVDGEAVGGWNETCETLLLDAVGRSPLAGRRWLNAAVARLLATGLTSDILVTPDSGARLEVRLGPTVAGSLQRVVVLSAAATAGRNETDLAETVSTLSHELRTPLTSMKSSLNLVLSGETGRVNEEQTHFLSMTMRNINRLDRLVSDLLDASRHQHVEPLLQRQRIDLGPVLRDAVQMQEAAARQAGLDLDFTGLPTKMMAHVDPDKIVQILANVVSNSIKYTPPGGLVRVWLEARPQPDTGLGSQLAHRFALPCNAFNLVVADSGVGMTAEDQDRIFEPWFRGREDRHQSAPGTGLGLHITRNLVEAHGGNIRLASEPGGGTTVWIRLPKDSETEGLMQSVRQLRGLAATGWAQNRGSAVAVLDGRPGTAALALAESFLRQWLGAGSGKIIELAPDLVATVVPDPEAWAEAWEIYCDDCGRSETAPRWQFLAWQAPDGNKDSISPELDRNTLLETHVPG